MEVLIVSKTHFGAFACVGGIVLDNLQSVRLMRGKDHYQAGDTPFNVGEVWDISFIDQPDDPPHIEDVYVVSQKLIRVIPNIKEFILKHAKLWRGSPNELFDGMLKWTSSGSGYLGDRKITPINSVGFWISDRDLVLEDNKYYVYAYRRWYKTNQRLVFKGYEPMIGVIPAGTICRISLSKWWKPKDIDIEMRCYLQLSGWYL